MKYIYFRVDKKRDRQERQILDSQERAFWDVHRPVPGCVNTTEVDFRKLSRSGMVLCVLYIRNTLIEVNAYIDVGFLRVA